ncbi:MAG: hypothetical protein ACI8T1_003211 [Verrucomicrobiales bacterium]|jgi:hypothetical protein
MDQRASGEASPRFGELEPRYICAINPFQHRFSRCLYCEGRTQIRKFALLIHVDPKGLFPTRITCKYCRPCGLVIVHKHELEAILRDALAQVSPDQVHSPFFIIGTIDMRTWTKLHNGSIHPQALKQFTSDFLNVTQIQRKVGGWREAP